MHTSRSTSPSGQACASKLLSIATFECVMCFGLLTITTWRPCQQQQPCAQLLYQCALRVRCGERRTGKQSCLILTCDRCHADSGCTCSIPAAPGYATTATYWTTSQQRDVLTQQACLKLACRGKVCFDLWQRVCVHLCRYNFGTAEVPLILMSYCTPIAPGRSRLLYCLAGERDKVPKKLQRIVDLMPSWVKFVNHFTRAAVLDGDNVFLHGLVSRSCC